MTEAEMDRELAAAAASVQAMASTLRDKDRIIACLVVAAGGNIFIPKGLLVRAPEIDLLVQYDYAEDGVNYNAFLDKSRKTKG